MSLRSAPIVGPLVRRLLAAREGLSVGQTVRVVEMRGCMAHVRGEVREGTITDVVERVLYDGTPTGHPTLMVLITTAAGEQLAQVAERRLWWPNEDDGVLEYRQ